ncbi:MAG: ATP-binding protein [Cytophagales bacterium]|nr:MAG: ATP-binding protein [Cytophagales bacterium]
MTKIYPFKFLDAYALKDKDIFFGREEETEQLYNLVHQSKMVWLYGASGTGKTSLIDCGLANQFKSYDWKAFFIRRGDNFNHSLDKTLCEASEGEYLFNKDKALDQLLKKLETVHILYLSPIYLIFDQLEELYILGSETEQKEFIQAIKQIYASPLPIKMLFSIREEYLGYLYEFEKAVPELLRKKLRVEPMNLDKINHVLNGIDQNPHTNVKLKEGEKEQIAEEIFNKIKGEEKSLFIQLPYLQVFLDRLYRRITQDETHQKEAVWT